MHTERFFTYVAACIVNAALLCVLFVAEGAEAVEGIRPGAVDLRAGD